MWLFKLIKINKVKLFVPQSFSPSFRRSKDNMKAAVHGSADREYFHPPERGVSSAASECQASLRCSSASGMVPGTQ